MGSAFAGDEIAADVKAAVNVASSEKIETEVGRTSLLLTLIYTLGAVAVIGATAVAPKRIFLNGKNE